MIYGYARVSSTGQSYESQLEELQAVGCDKIFHEKKTAKDGAMLAERKKLLKQLGPGDVLLITRIDRFFRSSRDMHNTIADITAKGAEFRSLHQHWNTATKEGRFLLSILAAQAELDRECIIERTTEGRARAKARGQHMGRPHALTPAQLAEARRRRADGEAISDLAISYNVGKSTLYRLCPAQIQVES